MQHHSSDRRRIGRLSSIAGILTLAAALVVAAIVPASAAAQTLVNGNFENNPNTGFVLVTTGTYVDPGINSWKVVSGNIDMGTGPAGTVCQFPGTHCIDLNGDSPGRIEQVVAGIRPRSTCTVTFYMSRHVSLARTSATLATFVNNVPTSPATFVHNVPGVTATNGHWQMHSFTFISGPTAVLAFASTMPGAAGPQIDNVTMKCRGLLPDTAVTAVPTDTALVPHRVEPPNPCCPPWNATTLADRMVYQSASGINGPYTLRFQSTATLNAQLIAYMAYLHAMDPSYAAIMIDFRLWDAGSGPTPGTLTAPSSTYTETWSTTSGPSPMPNFFNAGGMQTNRWYTIKTNIHLNDGNTFFPDTCANSEISVRIQVLGMVPNAQGHGAPMLQIRMANGQMIQRSLMQKR